MSLFAATLMAVAGVYAYAAFHALGLTRAAPHEYRSFAGYCAGLAVQAVGGALTWDAHSPADALVGQSLQLLAAIPTLVFFVHFILHLVEESRPRVIAATNTIGGVATFAVFAGLFFDPAHADPRFFWDGSSEGKAIAALSPVGGVLVLCLLALAAFALARLWVRSRDHLDLRIAAALTTLPIAIGVLNVVAHIAHLPTLVDVSIHVGIFSVIGFSYVLLGRFTSIDQELEARTEELARSYDHRRLTQEEIVKKEQLAAVGELSAVIAHEVRNPLAVLKNSVAGLRSAEISPEDGETLLEILDEETDRLDRLVDDLLAYARPIAPEPGRVALATLVGRAVELAAGGNRDISHIEIELELDAPTNDVDGDEALLRHALINIVDNALQAMPGGGTLTVSCRNAQFDGRPHVAVDFHDTGEGMDTLVRTRARDPFFTTRDTGTGLGLAIVDRVARAHGGRVEIESRHGRGTTVSFVIPCERSAE